MGLGRNPRCLASDWVDAAATQKSGDYRKKKQFFLGIRGEVGVCVCVEGSVMTLLLECLEFKVSFKHLD